MAIRPAKCYKTLKKKPYTRISVRRPRRSYVKGVPASKIHHFEVGKNGDYPLMYNLVAQEDIQLRSNALEALRLAAGKHLARAFGETGFFMKILVYPHHILRENAMATGAGADRFSQGMRMSFGRPVNQAARIRAGQPILMVKAPANSEILVKKALKVGMSKISGSYKIQARLPKIQPGLPATQ